jgi:hypothetical protein
MSTTTNPSPAGAAVPEVPELRRAVLTFAATVAVSVGMLLAVAVAARSGRTLRNSEMLVLLFALPLGVGAGAAVARWRVRLWCVVGAQLVVGHALIWGSAWARLDLVPFVGTGLLLGLQAGFLFLTPALDLVALWLPLAMGVGSAFVWLNSRHVVDTWRADKLSMWDLPSVGILAVTVFGFVMGLAARHRLTRRRWQERPVVVTAIGRPRPPSFGVAALGALLLVLVLGVSPFLFRSRDARCDDPASADCIDARSSSATASSSSPAPSSSSPPSPSPSWRPDDLTSLWRPAWDAVVGLVQALLVLAVTGALVTVLAVPLLRRRRLRAMERPDPSLPPTRRVELRFRRGLLALRQDLGVDVAAALDDPRALVAAARRLVDTDVEVDAAAARSAHAPGLAGVAAAADVWERVRFGGRGLPARAEADMAEALAQILAWTRAQRGPWRALVSAFSLPPSAAR